jgi:hypothetical protein
MSFLKKNKIATVLVMLALLFLVTKIRFLKVLQLQTAHINSETAENETKLTSFEDPNFTRFCEEYGEWEMLLDRQIYIKRTAAFYFVDANIFRVHVLVKNDKSILNRTFSLELVINVNNQTVRTEIANELVHIQVYDTVHEYAALFIEASLSMDGELNYSKQKVDSMSMIIVDKKTKTKTGRPLNVKIKNLLGDKTKKKGVMQCGKCLHMSKADDLSDMEWNIKLLKRMGYDKKHICDHMIEKDESFRRLFDEHKEFLEMDELKCIPNLQNRASLLDQPYLKNYADLRVDNDDNVPQFDVVNMLIENECYLNNIDKYRFIKVADTDELVFPRQIKGLSTLGSVRLYVSRIDYDQSDPFLRVTCDQDVKIESFLNKLDAGAKPVTTEISFNFKYGTHIFNSMVDELFKSLEIELANANTSSASSYRTIKLKQISFSINDAEELKYAASLLKLYKSYVKPLLDKSKIELTAKVGHFDRLFFVTGSASDRYYGKSIHNTRRSMDLHMHWSNSVIEIDKNNATASIRYGNGFLGKLELVSSPDIAHMSHFRKNRLRFDQMDSVIPFSSFHFDLNYLKCYMLPLLRY